MVTRTSATASEFPAPAGKNLAIRFPNHKVSSYYLALGEGCARMADAVSVAETDYVPS